MIITLKLAEFAEIETEHFFLRPVRWADAEDIFEIAKNEKNFHYVAPTYQSLEETKNIIVNQYMKNPLGIWALELKNDGKMIGIIHFSKRFDKEKKAEVAYFLNQNYWGKGLMGEVLSVIIAFSFREFGLRQLELLIDEENIASKKLAEKVGFSKSSRFKAKLPNAGHFHFFDRYEMTSKDYKKRVNQDV